MTSYSLYFTVQNTESARCLIPLGLVWAGPGGQPEHPDSLCQTQKEDPPTHTHTPPHPQLWDPCCGGLAARSAHPARWKANHRNSMQLEPWVSPACLDTMHHSKLCLPLYWTVTLLFCWVHLSSSFSLFFFFRSLPHCTSSVYCHFVAYCTQTLENSTEKFRE